MAATIDNPVVPSHLDKAGHALTRRQLVVPVLSIVAVALALGMHFLASEPSGVTVPTVAPSVTPAPRSVAMENTYGIRVTQLGITAGGGMVDLRYIVFDPDSARLIGSSTKDQAVLIVERNHLRMETAALTMRHRNKLRPGQTSFILFRNDDGAIRSGDRVTLVIGKVSLKHIVAF